MTEQEKLLLQVLSEMYPYSVVLHFDKKVEQDDEPLFSIRKNGNTYLINDAYYLSEIKPYLRSMFSMTKEEEKDFLGIIKGDFLYKGEISIPTFSPTSESVELPISTMVRANNWLYSHFFDINGLIEKGLALEAPKKMYE